LAELASEAPMEDTRDSGTGRLSRKRTMMKKSAAVAMAEGPTRVADLTKVAVFRTIDGRRAVALFDLAAIRQGRASDPAIFGDDIVVVDTSRMSSVIHGGEMLEVELRVHLRR